MPTPVNATSDYNNDEDGNEDEDEDEDEDDNLVVMIMLTTTESKKIRRGDSIRFQIGRIKKQLGI